MTDRSLIEPSDDEARNGWTAESLTAYVAAVNESTQRKLDWSKRGWQKKRELRVLGAWVQPNVGRIESFQFKT